jgi:hypothetical protein
MGSRQLESLDIDLLTVRRILPIVYDFNPYPSSYVFVTDRNGLLQGMSIYEFYSTYGLLITSTLKPVLEDPLTSSITSYTYSSFSSYINGALSTNTELLVSTISSLFLTYNTADGLSSLSSVVSFGLSSLSSSVGELSNYTSTSLGDFSNYNSTFVYNKGFEVNAGPGVSTLSTLLGSQNMLFSTAHTEYQGWFDFVSDSKLVSRFTDEGKLGVGCIPSNSLDISGVGWFTGPVCVNKSFDSIRHAELDVSGNAQINGTVLASNFATPSDRRLKTNIYNIENALSSIKELNGVYFQWKSSGNADVGVIAQDTMNVLPIAVQETNSSLFVSYDKIIPILIESIKELSAKVERLESSCVCSVKT